MSKNNPIEISVWIKKIIEGCSNSFHLDGANRLIDLFAERFGKGELHDELRGEYYSRLVQINY